MKHLKTKLMASVVMLLIAAVLMSTASYAWFTLSTNPEIANIQANVTANGNLEIALDAGANTAPGASAVGDAGQNETWGNLVDLKGFFKAGTNGDTIRLKPVQFLPPTATAPVTISKPVYGLDGRISSLSALNRVNAADATSGDDFKDFGGIWVYTDATPVTAATTVAAGSYDERIYAFEVDFWLRTNATGSTVSLSEAVSRTEDAADEHAGEIGLGSFISDEKNVTILFQDGEDWYMAQRGTPTTTAPDKYPLSLVSCTITETGVITVDASPETSIELTANTAKEIKMFVFMDGVALTNKDALLSIAEMKMNIQFTSSATLTSEDVEMNGHGRT